MAQTTDSDRDSLLQASEAGDLATVQTLLSRGVNPEPRGADQDGPLHYAAMYNHLDCVKALVAAGATVMSPGSYGRTALHYAAADAASPEAVRFLLAAGADLTALDDGGDSALFDLMTRPAPDPEVVRVLLAAGQDVNETHHSYGSALMWASYCQKLPVVQCLVEAGADLERVDQYGDTALLKAVSRQAQPIIDYLLDHGANPAAKNRFGSGLMDYAAESNNPEFLAKVLRLLGGAEHQPPEPGALCTAARQGHLDTVRLLIESGSPVDDRDSGQETALMKAAYAGHLDTARYLLDRGAVVHARDYRGNTALHHAAWAGHLELVELLLQRGAAVTAINSLGWTALMQAVLEGHSACVEILLAAGVPTDAIDAEWGETALTLAQLQGHSGIEKRLVTAGALPRPLHRRPATAALWPIWDCDICRYLPHRQDLGRQESPRDFPLLQLQDNYTASEAEATYTRRLWQCPDCQSVYVQDHSLDYEDAFVGGPRIHQNWQRLPLSFAAASLDQAEKTAAAEALRQQTVTLLPMFLRQIERSPTDLPERHRPYLLECLEDNYLMSNDWARLRAELLEHPEAEIAEAVTSDLITMAGDSPTSAAFPSYRQYRPFTAEQQAAARCWWNDHRADWQHLFQSWLKQSARQAHAERLIKSARYYKLMK